MKEGWRAFRQWRFREGSDSLDRKQSIARTEYRLSRVHMSVYALANGSLLTNYGEDPVYPSEADSDRHEAHEQWSQRNTKGDHECPYAHASSPALAEESLGDNGTTHSTRWADEESSDGAADSHRGVCRAFGAADVGNQAAGQRQKEDGSATIAICQRTPKQWGDTQYGND